MERLDRSEFHFHVTVQIITLIYPARGGFHGVRIRHCFGDRSDVEMASEKKAL